MQAVLLPLLLLLLLLLVVLVVLLVACVWQGWFRSLALLLLAHGRPDDALDVWAQVRPCCPAPPLLHCPAAPLPRCPAAPLLHYPALLLPPPGRKIQVRGPGRGTAAARLLLMLH